MLGKAPEHDRLTRFPLPPLATLAVQLIQLGSVHSPDVLTHDYLLYVVTRSKSTTVAHCIRSENCPCGHERRRSEMRNFALWGALAALGVLVWVFSTMAQKGNGKAATLFVGFIVVAGIVAYVMRNR
jgi:hypothetical protein